MYEGGAYAVSLALKIGLMASQISGGSPALNITAIVGFSVPALPIKAKTNPMGMALLASARWKLSNMQEYELTKSELGEAQRIRVAVRKGAEYGRCFFQSCSKPPIRSHVVQENGPLRDISVGGKIIQLSSKPMIRAGVRPPGYYEFVECDIGARFGDVATFYGFCNVHDPLLFESIEPKGYGAKVDWRCYRNQILQCYRIFCNELYKQEYNLKWYDEMFKSTILSEQAKNTFRQRYRNFLLSIAHARFLKSQFEMDLFAGTKSFITHVFEIPLVPICAAISYVVPTLYSITTVEMNQFLQGGLRRPESAYNFVNVFPSSKSLVVILATSGDATLPNRMDLDIIGKMSEWEKMLLVSRLILVHGETWMISPKTFYNWQKSGFDKFVIDTVDFYFPLDRKNLPLIANIFDRRRAGSLPLTLE
ncbi:hypothetical protein RT717_05890 [Imperialibacter roseus]|uniref:Uncharacterized protein n=1 Tax=Imperialibacter roseus TaxID=1324217 RepID=A0ABZ0IUU7_9BACT|nr:hypothetical protein [Imperialibacter roseus]WOK08165.1 hypothetical protein RT717_05890 [Imperialibacter roseus]